MQNILELTILKMKKYFFKSKIIHYFQEIVCRGNFRISKYTVYNQATFFFCQVTKWHGIARKLSHWKNYGFSKLSDFFRQPFFFFKKT